MLSTAIVGARGRGCVCICIHTLTYIISFFIYVHMHMYTVIQIRKYTRTYTYIYIYTCVSTDRYIYIHTHIYVSTCFIWASLPSALLHSLSPHLEAQAERSPVAGLAGSAGCPALPEALPSGSGSWVQGVDAKNMRYQGPQSLGHQRNPKQGFIFWSRAQKEATFRYTWSCWERHMNIKMPGIVISRVPEPKCRFRMCM